MEEKNNDQIKLGEYIPTFETKDKAFQEDAQRNFRIVVEGKSSEWKRRGDIAILNVHGRMYIGVSDLYHEDLPKKCALKVDVVDEDGDTDFYKFKIIDLIAETILGRDDVEDILRDPLFAEDEYRFDVRDSKLKGFIKIMISERGDPSLSWRVNSKKEVEDYLNNVFVPEEFEVINEDGEQINVKKGEKDIKKIIF